MTATAAKTLAGVVMAWGWGSSHPQFQPINYHLQPLALPATLFALAQFLALGVSFGICWLFFQQWPLWSRRAGWLLSHRFSSIAAGIGLALFALLVQGLSYEVHRILPPSVYGATTLYANYSTLFVWPVQIITVVALTLILARRRFLLGRAT